MKPKLVVLRWLAVAFAAFLVIAEIGLRMAGAIDFPVYDADKDIGYIPHANQKGSFMLTRDWQVNERSMGSGPWAPHGDRDLLLLGDSVVWGGNPYDQADKFGPQLQASVPAEWKVWSAGAGSWSVLNETAYLSRFPDVVDNTDLLVWVVNTADLGEKSFWRSDLIHPRQRPPSSLVYVAQKYLLPQAPAPTEAPPTIRDDQVTAFRDQLKVFGNRRVLVVLYPAKRELAQLDSHYVAFRSTLKEAMGACCEFLEVRALSTWHAGLYRDAIHPTPEGYGVLAREVAKALQLVPATAKPEGVTHGALKGVPHPSSRGLA